MKPLETRTRKVDVLFNQYAQLHQNPVNRMLQWLCIPLLVFSIIGLVTAIPFPHLNFLGKYNTYISWFSFLLTFTIYYYIKLSPILSYLMLLIIGILYYFIIELEYVEKEGGPALWLVSLVIFIIAATGLFIGNKKEQNKVSFTKHLHFLLIGPIWLIGQMLKKLNISY